MLNALTRKPGRSLSECELTFAERQKVDYEKANFQHDAYERVLEELGCRVISLPALEAFPDSVFVEDTAVILPEIAVLCSLGAESRLGEVDSLAPQLSEFRDTERIQPPALIDGGDVLTVGKTIFVGQSTRTNRKGFEQFKSLIAPLGYSVIPVDVKGALHLKTLCTKLDEETLVVEPEWLDLSHFTNFRLLETPEPFGANCLKIGEKVLASASFAETNGLLEDEGYKVLSLDISEFEKMEAGLTCMSLII